MLLSSYQQFLFLYKRYGLPHLRMGQFFVSRYIKNPWPELFYEREESKAAETIVQWLNDNCYTTELPQTIYKVEEHNEFS